MRMKPQTKYKAGFFLFKGQKKSMVGSLLPQPEVITQHGQRVLLDEVLGSGFALLRGHANAAEAFASLNTDFWEHMGAQFVCIQTDDAQSSRKLKDVKKDTRQHDTHKDPSKSPHSQPLPIVVVRSMDEDFLRKSQDHFIVVRPDRFILGIFKEEEADIFVSAFQHLLVCDR
jgi:3-(3-hydroxy-phenyl)propionate hydroxylase